MPSTEERIRTLVQAKLDLEEVNFDAKLSDAGVSSVDILAFVKVIEKEFNVTIPSEDFVKVQNLRELVTYLDARAG